MNGLSGLMKIDTGLRNSNIRKPYAPINDPGRAHPESIAAHSTFGRSMGTKVLSLDDPSQSQQSSQTDTSLQPIAERGEAEANASIAVKGVRDAQKARERAEDEREEQKKKEKKAVLLDEAERYCYRELRTSDYKAHRLRNPDPGSGTCQWLLHEKCYCEWRFRQGSGLLWLSADPGCGKSVLASYLVSHLKDRESSRQDPEIVSFFFFKNDNSEQDNAISALQALLHQLYTAQPPLLEIASEFVKRC